MHCPRCGQLQVSEETKFCSRCGFPLGLVSELLTQGGFLPQLADLHKDKKWLTRKNGLVFGLLWLIFFLPLCTIIFGGIFGNEILGGITAALGIFGSLMIFIASLVLLKPAPKTYSHPVPNELANIKAQGLYGAKQTALPPSMETYIPPMQGSWRDTNDLTPTSVTESTTKLLQKDEKE